MKIAELIRDLLNIVDGKEVLDPEKSDISSGSYTDQDIKRFRQIVDLADQSDEPYSTRPNEKYADISSVTHDAGADSWQGNKHPADIRGEHPSVYLGTLHGRK